MVELTDRGKRFRTVIADFIEARRIEKVKKEKGDDPSRYVYATWLAEAASRARNLKIVTHPIKFTHSAIKGASSVHIGATPPFMHGEIGTHSVRFLEEDFAISDAKHLDVYSLLKEVVDGRRLLDWLRDGDADFTSALDGDPAKAEELMSGFAKILQMDEKVVSHPLAKQVYWLTGEDPSDDKHFHLLQPMFSSSLEHAVNEDIRSTREARFAARGTRKQEATLANHSTYPVLLGRTVGGSNAQNVSPQNKVRGGTNHLLPSMPPIWDIERHRKLVNIDSAMQQLTWFDDVRDTIKYLADFLLTDPPANDATRTTRCRIEQELGVQLTLYAAQVWVNAESGWTRDEQCKLPMHQKIWLDPGRVEEIARDPTSPDFTDDDRQFHAAFAFGDWPDQVAGDFANWVNERLREVGLTNVGDVEYKHWAKQAIVEASWPVPMQRSAPTRDAI